MATNDSTNYTSRTMEPRPHNAQKILRRSKLRNAHRDVNVGRVATKKSKYCNPNHFNISYFRNPKPFHFLVSHLCNWLVELLLWPLHQFVFWFESIDNGRQCGVCCTMYSVLFMTVYLTTYQYSIKFNSQIKQVYLTSFLTCKAILIVTGDAWRVVHSAE